MGYYVESEESIFHIKAANLDVAYKVMCRLNDNDAVKRGGGHYGADKVSPGDPRPEGMNHHPAKWFSWMDANYPETCLNFDSLMKELGFETTYDEATGDLIDIVYTNEKSGQQDLFLAALAPFVEVGSYIIWRDNEGDRWKNVFAGGVMTTKKGRVVYA